MQKLFCPFIFEEEDVSLHLVPPIRERLIFPTTFSVPSPKKNYHILQNRINHIKVEIGKMIQRTMITDANEPTNLALGNQPH